MAAEKKKRSRTAKTQLAYGKLRLFIHASALLAVWKVYKTTYTWWSIPLSSRRTLSAISNLKDKTINDVMGKYVGHNKFTLPFPSRLTVPKGVGTTAATMRNKFTSKPHNFYLSCLTSGVASSFDGSRVLRKAEHMLAMLRALLTDNIGDDKEPGASMYIEAWLRSTVHLHIRAGDAGYQHAMECLNNLSIRYCKCRNAFRHSTHSLFSS